MTADRHFVACARCGDPARYLVSQRYEPDSIAGRLMPYCDPCRREYAASVAVAIPLDIVRNDPDRVLTHLYRDGFTATVPDGLPEMLRVPDSGWTVEAKSQLDEEVEARDGVHQVIAWAHDYNAYRRLAATPEHLENLLEPAFRIYRATGEVPAWCGVDLLRGWAFLLVRADRFTGGYGLSDPDSEAYRELVDVCRRLAALPEIGPLDTPPPML